MWHVETIHRVVNWDDADLDYSVIDFRNASDRHTTTTHTLITNWEVDVLPQTANANTRRWNEIASSMCTFDSNEVNWMQFSRNYPKQIGSRTCEMTFPVTIEAHHIHNKIRKIKYSFDWMEEMEDRLRYANTLLYRQN